MEDKAAPKMNFAAIAAQEKKKGSGEESTPLRVVQIDGLAVLKIVKHCREAGAAVTGQLLGLDIGATLEVTNCFAFPNQGADHVDDYQLEMMRCLREVNIDNNTVGWYQSTVLGSYQSVELIETFLSYQESIKRCVCIVYDPDLASQGRFALKALKLREKFMEAYREEKINTEYLRLHDIGWAQIFEDIPIHLHNSSLVSALMTEVDSGASLKQDDFDRLSMGDPQQYLGKYVELLGECLDDLSKVQQEQIQHQRQILRNQQQQQQWIQKRKAENAERRARGEEPLPEEDPSNPIFKPIPPPPTLEGLLIMNQTHNYVSQVNKYAGQTIGRLRMTFALNSTQ